MAAKGTCKSLRCWLFSSEMLSSQSQNVKESLAPLTSVLICVCGELLTHMEIISSQSVLISHIEARSIFKDHDSDTASDKLEKRFAKSTAVTESPGASIQQDS